MLLSILDPLLGIFPCMYDMSSILGAFASVRHEKGSAQLVMPDHNVLNGTVGRFSVCVMCLCSRLCIYGFVNLQYMHAACVCRRVC